MTAPAAPPTRVPVVSFWLIPPQPARSIATEKPAHIPTARLRIVFAVWNMMPLCGANASPGTPNPNRSQGAACIFCAVEDNGGSFRSLRHAHGVNSQTNAPLGWQRPGARLQSTLNHFRGPRGRALHDPQVSRSNCDSDIRTREPQHSRHPVIADPPLVAPRFPPPCEAPPWDHVETRLVEACVSERGHRANSGLASRWTSFESPYSGLRAARDT